MNTNRFTALDSWRGIAACMVALFHVRAFSHVEELDLVRHAYLFVDFFFVLSGFVIACNYEQRLAAGFSTARFMLLRFGRLYPLHFAVLMAFWVVELPSAERWSDALAHLFLLNGFGRAEDGLWNAPSWSISTEFFTYLAFALAVSLSRGRLAGILAVALAASPVIILFAKGDMSATGKLGMIRCVYGFAAGVTAWHIFRRFEPRIPAGTSAEVLAALGVLLFVSMSGKSAWSITAPAVYLAAVLVFARQKGAVSAMLGRRPLLFLGAVSYSIYMVHYFIARRTAAWLMWGKAHGIGALDYLGVNRWAGDLLILGYLALVIAVSAASYRLIEMPFREAFRRLAQRLTPAVAPA